MMDDPVLVLVSGAPGTGKTTLARRPASDLRIPYIGKDFIKESLAGTLGVRDRQWSMKLGVASIVLLFELIEAQLKAGRSAVSENNYRREYEVPRFERLRGLYPFKTVEVHCEAEAGVLLSRLKGRRSSGARHPVHTEGAQLYAELEGDLARGTFDALDLGETLIRVDTTDFERVEYQGVLSAVQESGQTLRALP